MCNNISGTLTLPSSASKAKALLDDEDHDPQSPTTRLEDHNEAGHTGRRKTENPSLQRCLDAITSSLNYIGTAVEVRLQLETLLAEKARLAHENSIYKRENLYLRGVVEYHQLTMQDVVYFDERTEQVTEVYPVNVTSVSSSSSSSNPQVLEFK
ncbi:hypothetical protein YC2023_046799 [Brassica napus]